MTKKHFEAIARIIREVKQGVETQGGVDAVNDITEKLSTFFKQDNPRFDKNRFEEACGKLL